MSINLVLEGEFAPEEDVDDTHDQPDKEESVSLVQVLL